ncbi:MAG: JAB domain-containing protein [Spirochaetales bacterium]|nr:JAB domain-containing protein [Spirochaetales bacterium]
MSELTIMNSRIAESLLHENLSTLDHEEVWSIYLNYQSGLIGSEMVSKGTLDKTAIDCRTVLRQVLLKNAAGLILLHNHPGGNARPSTADMRFTRDLQQACDIMGIRFVDHIIVGKDSFYSFIEERLHKLTE